MSSQPKTDIHTRGRFFWHDLMTTDAAASTKFYEQLLGWKVETPKGEDGYHHLYDKDGKGVGGMMKEPAPGVPSHWLGYITTEDVAKTTAQAQELGSKLYLPATAIPNVGIFSVVEDPHGAVFAPFYYANGETPETGDKPAVGSFCWNELVTPEPAAAAKYYSALFGWTFDETDMGPMGTYRVAKRGDKQVAGIMQTPPGAPPRANWVHYIAVDDVDASTRNAGEIGGKVFMPPMDIPNIGRFSIVADPTGGVFALFQG